MPDEPQVTSDPSIEAENPPAAETPAAAAPRYASQETVDQLIAQNAHLQSGLQTVLQALGQVAAGQHAPAPAAPEFSEDQLAEMLESGDGKQILRAQRFLASQETARLRAYVDEQQAATLAIGQELTQRIAKQDMPLYGQDPEIARDMDALLSQMHPAARANPKALELVYRQVVADPKHFDRVIARKVEETLRQRATSTVADPAQSASSRSPVSKATGKPIPTAADILGPENAHALASIGKDEDSFARSLGFSDWVDFIEKTDNVDPTTMTR